MSALSESEMDRIPTVDPTYLEIAEMGYDVVDASLLKSANSSTNVVSHIAQKYCGGSVAEATHLFFRHMKDRMVS